MRKIRTQWSVHCDEWYQHASAMHEAVQIRIRIMTDTQPSGMHKIRDRNTAIRHAQDSWSRRYEGAFTIDAWYASGRWFGMSAAGTSVWTCDTFKPVCMCCHVDKSHVYLCLCLSVSRVRMHTRVCCESMYSWAPYKLCLVCFREMVWHVRCTY